MTDLGGRERAESLDVPLGVVVDVRLTGTMATLAAERGRRRAGSLTCPCLALARPLACVSADRARLGTGVARRGRYHYRCRGRLRHALPRVNHVTCRNADDETHDKPEEQTLHRVSTTCKMPA